MDNVAFSYAIEMSAIADHLTQARKRLETMRKHATLPWDIYSWLTVLSVLEKYITKLVDQYRGAASEDSSDPVAGELL